MRPDKAKVVDEVWDDERIDSFLAKQAMGGEPEDFSLLLNAYRSMRAEDFERFLVKFKAAGRDVSATDRHGQSLLQNIADHDKSTAFKELLTRYS